jgi:hypothetical protein
MLPQIESSRCWIELTWRCQESIRNPDNRHQPHHPFARTLFRHRHKPVRENSRIAVFGKQDFREVYYLKSRDPPVFIVFLT